jgi:hypothetical protein
MAVGYKNENGVKITEESNRRDIVSAPKIATLLGVAGMFGVMASVLLGKLAGADYLLDTAFVCLSLAGVILILHVSIGLWTDFTRSA